MIRKPAFDLVKRIQNCIETIHHQTVGSLARGIHHNRSYKSYVFNHPNHVTLYNFLIAEGNFLNEPTALIYQAAIMNNTKILQSYLDNYCKKITKQFSPLRALMLHDGITPQKCAILLHVSTANVYNNLLYDKLHLDTIRYVARIFDTSAYQLALLYGYHANDIRTYKQKKDNKTNNKIGKYLKSLRKHSRLTQVQLSHRLGIAQGEITALESWKIPSQYILLKYATLYQLPILTFMKLLPKYKPSYKDCLGYKLMDIMAKRHMSARSLAYKTQLSLKYVYNIMNVRTSKTSVNQDRLQIIAKKLRVPLKYFKGCYLTPYERNFRDFVNSTHLKADDFGYRYNKIRCHHQMSFYRLGKLMHVSTTAAHDISRQHSVQKSTLNRIINIFPKDRDYLLGY